MENLPIDTKSLPSRIFYSEEEDKVYVGEPGDYKEVGGGGDGLPPSEEGKFLVGGASDWEKRGITGQDVNITVASGSRVPYWNAGTQAWLSGGVQVANAPSSGTLAGRTAGPDIGRLKANPAIETDDLVPLGQLNTILENLELPADQVSYDNTASGLDAINVQDAVDEIAEGYVPYSEVTSTATANKVVGYSSTGTVNTNEATLPNNAVPLFQMKSELNNVVRLTGNQTVAGVKTFTSSPVVPTATTPTQAVNKGQMDTALGAYVNAGTDNTTSAGFSLDKLVLRNSTSSRTTITKPNTDVEDSTISIPGFGGGTKVMPISVNGVSAGASGDISLTLDIDKFIYSSLGGSSPSVNINFAAANPNIEGYEEIEIGIQFLEKPTSVTDFYLTFNNNTSLIYNSHLFDSVSGNPHEFSDESGFRFKFDSDYGMYTFRVKNNTQIGIPKIITGTGVEVGNESSTPIPWVIGGAWHEDINVTSFQIKTVDGTTNVPYMRVTVKKVF